MRRWTVERFTAFLDKKPPRKKDIAEKGDQEITPEAARPGMIPSRGSISFAGLERRRGMGKADL